MTEAVATVYDPPASGQPYVAVILMSGKVIFAEAVASVDTGEQLLKHMLRGIADLAAREGHS